LGGLLRELEDPGLPRGGGPSGPSLLKNVARSVLEGRRRRAEENEVGEGWSGEHFVFVAPGGPSDWGVVVVGSASWFQGAQLPFQRGWLRRSSEAMFERALIVWPRAPPGPGQEGVCQAVCTRTGGIDNRQLLDHPRVRQTRTLAIFVSETVHESKSFNRNNSMADRSLDHWQITQKGSDSDSNCFGVASGCWFANKNWNDFLRVSMEVEDSDRRRQALSVLMLVTFVLVLDRQSNSSQIVELWPWGQYKTTSMRRGRSVAVGNMTANATTRPARNRG
jgi:hypothetical protein